MKKVIGFILGILFIVGCANQEEREYNRLSGFTQGTTYTITYFDELKRDFSEPINVILEMVDSSMSLYRKNSVINAFNNSEKGIKVDSLLAQVVEQSILLNTQTQGAFDITVGPLVRAWGFHMKKGEFPTDDEIQRLLAFKGPDMIELNGLFLSKKFPQVIIDVNAIAQGYTVDLIAEHLERKGVKDYLVEVGGEIRTLGKSPRGKHWMVGVDKPEDNAITGESLQVILKLSGESMVTSGNYRKFFVRDGVKYSHTIDPNTGYPVSHTLLSATVIDKTSARADALATAFMVMGTDAAIEWLAKNPEVEGYLIYSDNTGEYKVWMNESIKKRIVE
jgi:thiamine biosynthesis lipoprotein